MQFEKKRHEHLAPEPCPHCDGKGYEADYVGLEMKPVQVDCSFCYGTGLRNKLND